MTFINKNSKISIIDNSGCTRFRLIDICRFGRGRLGDLCIGSLNRVKARRRLKKGQIFRALFVQSRFSVFREAGVYIRSLATRSILIRRNEYTPLANRLNSFYFVELKNLQSFRISAITIYSVLLFTMSNFRFFFAFNSYISLENEIIKDFSVYPPANSKVFFSSATRFLSSNVFDIARFVHLIYKILGFKPAIRASGKFNSVFFRVSGYYLFRLIAKLHKVRFGAKSNFMKVFFLQNRIFISVREPHTIFNVFSPYFDYHSSIFNFTISGSTKNNTKLFQFINWLR